MSKLVEFLAQLGQDSELSRASGEELQAAMEHAGLTTAEQIALANADRRGLEAQAKAVASTCCIIFPAEEGEENEPQPAPQIRAAA